jgi:hypothetical protein
MTYPDEHHPTRDYGRGYHPSFGVGSASGYGPGPGSGPRPGAGPGHGPGAGYGAGPGYGPGNGAGQAPGHGPEHQPGYEPSFGRGYGAGYDPPASLVRPYFLAGGRSRPSQANLEMITLVVAMTDRIDEAVSPEHSEIMIICQNPSSVAEVSARTNLPLIVVKVLLSDLIERGYLIYRSPPVASDAPSPELLQAVLDGIRRL